MDDHHQVAGNEEVAVDVCGDQLPEEEKDDDDDEDDGEEEDADDVDVCGDQLPDQTKITLRMIGIFKIPAGRLREDKLPHDPPVENAS